MWKLFKFLGRIHTKQQARSAPSNKRYAISHRLYICFDSTKFLLCEVVGEWSGHYIPVNSNFMNLTFRCSSLELLLSTVKNFTKDNSWYDAISHYKQTPLHSDKRYISLGDIAIKLLSTLIAFQRAIILKAISLSFLSERWTVNAERRILFL